MKQAGKVLLLLLSGGLSMPAMAGGHAHIGIVIGGPLWGPPVYAYGPPVYYPPVYAAPPLLSPPAAPVYIEQDVDSASPQGKTEPVWYYCRKPKGYYPYVKRCPVGWQPVAPVPDDHDFPPR